MLPFVVLSVLLVSVAGAIGQDTNSQQNTVGGIEEIYKPHLSEQLKNCQEFDLNHVVLRLYTREQANREQIIKINDQGKSLKKSFYNVRKNTKFLIQGWGQPQDLMKKMVPEYLFTQDVNVILVDWSEYALSCNFQSIRDVMVSKVAQAVSMLMQNLLVYGSHPREDFHLIGYGVGAHIAGKAGRDFYPKRIARISGLDPTGLMYTMPGSYRLKNGDALFVDVIYTSLPVVAADHMVADATFYPNGGTHPQPNCGEDKTGELCSTYWSMSVWKASIKDRMPAYQCESYAQYKENKCQKNYAYIGEYASIDARGKYYLDMTVIPPLDDAIVTRPRSLQ